jgi:serine/threonine-protein phosphatase 6 regulatory ankyrin repeat subunit B
MGFSDLVAVLVEAGVQSESIDRIVLERDEAGRNSLHCLVLGSSVEAMEAVLHSVRQETIVKGMTTEDLNGHTPVAIAVDLGNPVMIRLVRGYASTTELVQKSLSISDRDVSVRTTGLIEAVKGEDSGDEVDEAAVQAEVDRGVPVDGRDGDGMTALQWAAFLNKEKAVALLLDAGASVKAEYGERRVDALGIAAHAGSLGAMRTLLEWGADPNGPGGRAAPLLLVKGMDEGHAELEAVGILLKAGASPSPVGDGGNTPLHVAALHGDTALAQVLLAAGASRSARNNRKETPFAVARRAGAAASNDDLAQFADILAAAVEGDAKELAAAADCEVDTSASFDHLTGRSALHLACLATSRGAPAAVEALLRCPGAEAGVLKPDIAGDTAMHAAASSGPELTRLLYTWLRDRLGEATARREIAGAANKQGQTPLDVATPEARMVLAEGDAEDESDDDDDDDDRRHEEDAFFAAVEASDQAAVASLLAREPHLFTAVSPLDDSQRTALHMAVLNEDAGMVEVLLRGAGKPGAGVPADAVVDVRDKAGKTPLIAAAAAGLDGIVRTLLAAGANPQLLAKSPLPPHVALSALHYAVALGAEGVPTVRALLAGGADPSIKDSAGETPRDLAEALGSREAVEALARSSDPKGSQEKGKPERPALVAPSSPSPPASPSRLEPLIGAGDARGVEALVLRRPSLANAQLADGSPALVHAVLRGQEAVATTLLLRGASVNAFDRAGRTALSAAVSINHHRLVEQLLASGADPDAANALGMTPLHVAAENSNPTIADMLLERRAAVNAADAQGRTPLHVAASMASLPVIKVLLQFGANTRLKSSDGLTAYDLAVEQDPECAAALAGHAYTQIPGAMDSNALCDSVREGDMAAILAALDAGGVDVNAKDSNGNAPVHLAVKLSRQEVLELLLARGADVDAVTRDRRTPLLLAARLGNLSVLKLLLDRGADPRAADENGLTALHLAAYNGFPRVVEHLLSLAGKVDPDQIDTRHNTPLHMAASAGHDDVIRILLQAGADPHARNRKSQTPYDVASERRFASSASLLATTWHTLLDAVDAAKLAQLLDGGYDVNLKDSDGNHSLHYAVELGDAAIVELLIAKGAGIELKNKSAQTPLVLAARMAAPAAVFDALLKAGASVAATDRQDRTALHFAASRGDPAVVARLIEAGAAVNARDDTGQVPLHAAGHAGSVETVRRLLDAGADPSVQSMRGRTALDVAVARKHAECATVLRDAMTKGDKAKKRTSGSEADFGASGHHGSGAGATPRPRSRSSSPTAAPGAAGSYIHNLVRLGDVAGLAEALDKDPEAVNARDVAGYTPLHRAVQKRQLEIAEMLLARGADTSARCPAGRLPLHDASRIGDPAMLEALLMVHEGSVDAPDNLGRTPLHFAANACHTPSVLMLLEFGANSGVRDKQGRLPENVIPSERPHAKEVAHVLAASPKRPVPATKAARDDDGGDDDDDDEEEDELRVEEGEGDNDHSKAQKKVRERSVVVEEEVVEEVYEVEESISPAVASKPKRKIHQPSASPAPSSTQSHSSPPIKSFSTPAKSLLTPSVIFQQATPIQRYIHFNAGTPVVNEPIDMDHYEEYWGAIYKAEDVAASAAKTLLAKGVGVSPLKPKPVVPDTPRTRAERKADERIKQAEMPRLLGKPSPRAAIIKSARESVAASPGSWRP